MVPPMFMDLQPDSRVLDICAAPGSKTMQLMEGLKVAAQAAGQPVTGCSHTTLSSNAVQVCRGKIGDTSAGGVTERVWSKAVIKGIRATGGTGGMQNIVKSYIWTVGAQKGDWVLRGGHFVQST